MNIHDRKTMLRFVGLIVVFFLVFNCTKTTDKEAQTGEHKMPNVLFISVDDLNDWIEPLGGRCDRITSLMDIFPTLVELCGLPYKKGLDGHSLVPLLRDPNTEWDYPAITTYDFLEFSIRTQNWRYTRYIDDSEELYDHNADPEEWNNLANKQEYKEIKENLSRYIPKNPAPLTETSYKLMPHHIPPFKSKEDYNARKAIKEKRER